MSSYGGKSYGKVRYVYTYTEAPDSAKYILRYLGRSIILEKYDGLESSEIISEFPESAVESREALCNTLTQCRELILPDKSTIWVEKPTWMLFAEYLQTL